MLGAVDAVAVSTDGVFLRALCLEARASKPPRSKENTG
jgi:hypothetical protein